MMQIAIVGPTTIGQPQVMVRASGAYSPDVMHDLKARAIESYLAVCEAAYEPLDVDESVGLVPTDESDA